MKQLKTENMKEYMRNYMNKYRVSDLGKSKEKVVCSECGYLYNKSNEWHHKRAKKHKYKILELEVERLRVMKNPQDV